MWHAVFQVWKFTWLSNKRNSHMFRVTTPLRSGIFDRYNPWWWWLRTRWDRESGSGDILFLKLNMGFHTPGFYKLTSHFFRGFPWTKQTHVDMFFCWSRADRSGWKQKNLAWQTRGWYNYKSHRGRSVLFSCLLGLPLDTFLLGSDLLRWVRSRIWGLRLTECNANNCTAVMKVK